jgi:DNA-damage-inducible protein D
LLDEIKTIILTKQTSNFKMENKLEKFEEEVLQKIRTQEYNGQLYFSIVDIISILVESKSASRYWTELKSKLEKQEEANELFDIIEKLKFLAPDGKMRPTECLPRVGILRLIMSIPSPKAEPLKLWLAKVGDERIEETLDPELGFDRLKEIYRAKGYPDEWIERRLQSIDIRKQLTDEWKTRGVKEGQEYSILTAVIAKGTFGMTPAEHKKYKGLENSKENLRDHMTPLELILTSLSEEVTRTITIKNDAQGFEDAHDAAVKGGELGGRALKDVEKTTGQKVVSKAHFKKQNTLSTPEDIIEHKE